MKNLFKAKVFREGGGGREYRESFQDNKVKLISFFLLMWHREAFQISGGIGVNLSYKLHILLFFSKYSSKAGGHAPQTPLKLPVASTATHKSPAGLKSVTKISRKAGKKACLNFFIQQLFFKFFFRSWGAGLQDPP